MCKCPNSQPIESDWHVKNNKKLGIDFRYIYKNRKGWWFCPVYIPTDVRFKKLYYALENHIATTGFAAIWEIAHLPVKKIYITGFDFFQSGVHNVNERWRPGDSNDPIGHRPDLEKKLLHKLIMTRNNIELDKYLLREINNLK
jgi:hypothetical protein